MGDPHTALDRLAGKEGAQLLELAGCLADLDLAAIEDGHAGGVVSSVGKVLETFN
jgi:hypothetical protein